MSSNLTATAIFQRCNVNQTMYFHTHQQITTLKSNRFIFVFGSNVAGRHGAGAARVAAHNFGAEYGKGFGLYGQSFALPTKDENIETLPLTVIHAYIDGMLSVAEQHHEYMFVLTEVGCGLAGYTASDIAPLFAKYIEQSIFNSHPNNIIFPKAFVDVLLEMYRVDNQYNFDIMDVTNHVA